MTTNVIELLQSSVELSSGNNDNLKEFLQSCFEHGAFYHKENTNAVVKSINSSLNSSFDKEKGLLLLCAFLPQISVEAYLNNAVSWMTQCNKILHQKGETIDSIGLKVLTQLIQLSVKFPEVSKETVKQIVPKFLLNRVKHQSDPQVSVQLLECLQACMTEYPGPSGEFRTDILKMVLSVVERKGELVRAAAGCVPLVARVGGGGKQGVSHKIAWQRLQLALIHLLHCLLSKIYEHVHCEVEIKINPPDDLQLSLQPVDEQNTLIKTQRLASQFNSVALFLQTMLLEKFPVAKLVAPDAILDVIAHAQKPTHSTLGTSREALAVLSVLPSIQGAALHLLESLVLCLGRNLVPRGGLVSYLCSQVIVWTHQQHADWPYAMDKPYSHTRLAAYCCLYSWLSVASTASQVDTLVDKAVPVMLTDIHAQKPAVRLKVGSRSAKGKRKQQMLVNIEDRSEKLGDICANRSLCERALLTLDALIRATTTALKPETLKHMTETVLTLAAEPTVPYSDSSCLSALYQLLLTLCISPHPSVPPPLAATLITFTAGLHHPDPQVRTTCSSGISSLESIIHPTAPTLYFHSPHKGRKPILNLKEDESESSEIEEFVSLKKKRKTDSPDHSTPPVSIVLIDSDSESISLVSESTEKKVDSETVNVFKETIEVFLDKKNSLDTPEIIPEKNNSENMEVVQMESKAGLNRDDADPLPDECTEIVQTHENDPKPLADDVNEKDKDNKEATECNVQPSQVPPDHANTESDDIEVVQMMMDFSDVINSDND